MKIKRRPLHHVIFSKAIRRSMLAVVSIVVLVVGGGLFYTWWVNRNAPAPAVESATTSVKPNPLFAHTAPDPNAQVGVSVQTFTSPIPPGSDVMMTVKTYPEAACSIVAKYNEVEATDPGLVPKTADEYGLVAWDWFVDNEVPQGTWPVDIICMHHQKTGTVRANLVVKKETI